MKKMDQLNEKVKSLPQTEVVLDVRGKDEYQAGHVPGSINIPHDKVTEHLEALKKYELVYIHCRKGGRAQKAMNALTDAGLTNLHCIDDSGMEHWENKGYPIEK